MNTDFFNYLQQLELMAFFSGFPLVWALVFFIAGKKENRNRIKKRLVRILPLAYALTGTLFLGLQLKKLYPDYSTDNIKQILDNPWLVAWGLLSVLFWIPALGRKPAWALFHSLVFFFFVLMDMIWYTTGKTDRSVLNNSMNIYTNSVLLNTFCLVLLLGLYYILYNKRTQHSKSR